jgi:hypothetical protein
MVSFTGPNVLHATDREQVFDATKFATEFTHLAIETAPSIGKGNGPLNHLHSIGQMIVPRYKMPFCSYSFLLSIIQANGNQPISSYQATDSPLG